ncbi:MAG: hypothetical protein RI571_06085 [Roseovarius sp.]|nr:hypothetical protein [Roseovarius sp.]
MKQHWLFVDVGKFGFDDLPTLAYRYHFVFDICAGHARLDRLDQAFPTGLKAVEFRSKAVEPRVLFRTHTVHLGSIFRAEHGAQLRVHQMRLE